MRASGGPLIRLSRCTPTRNRPHRPAIFDRVTSYRRSAEPRLLHTPASARGQSKCLELLERNPELSPEEAKIEHGWILAHLREEAVSARQDEDMKGAEDKILQDYCARRGSGEPLQYILGSVDFGPLIVRTRAPIFIPRPETAYVVERLVDRIVGTSEPGSSKSTMKILDLCTGSGSLALLLAHHLRSRTHITGTDINPEAVSLAQENARLNKLEAYVEFKVQDFFDLPTLQDYDMIVSNPPYIPRAEWDELASSVKDYEDPRALIGNRSDLPEGLWSKAGTNTSSYDTDDGLGLDFYRRIASLIPSIRTIQQSASGRAIRPLAAVEIGPMQADDVRKLFENESKAVGSTEVWKDQYGRDRMVLAFGK